MRFTKSRPEAVVQWVSCEWLEGHIGRDQLTVVDAQPSIHDYVQEHIPGAVYLSEGILRVSRGGIPSHFSPPEAMEANLRQLGVRAEVPVVVYTGTGAISKRGDGIEQAHVAYALARFGLDRVYILDGGLDRWREEGRQLSKAFPRVAASALTVAVRRHYFLELEEVRALLGQPDTLLIDSRPPEIYNGQAHWALPGHIPGSINLAWTAFLDADNPRLLRSRDEIREIAQRHHITPDRAIVCYCGTGRKAITQFLILKWCLGYPDVKVYEGSFTEWSAVYPGTGAGNPTELGASPG